MTLDRRKRIQFAITLAWILNVLLLLRFSFGFINFGTIYGLIMAGSFLYLIASLIAGFIKWNKRLITPSARLFAFVITAFLASNLFSMWQANASKKRSLLLTHALEQYKTDHAVYPATLDPLVPNYLPSIPRTRMGWMDIPYHYARPADDRYALLFPFPNSYHFRYDSQTGTWTMRD